MWRYLARRDVLRARVGYVPRGRRSASRGRRIRVAMGRGSSWKNARRDVRDLRANRRAMRGQRNAKRGRRIRVAKANGLSWHSVPMVAMAMCVDLAVRANANVPTMPNSNVVLAHG